MTKASVLIVFRFETLPPQSRGGAIGRRRSLGHTTPLLCPGRQVPALPTIRAVPNPQIPDYDSSIEKSRRMDEFFRHAHASRRESPAFPANFPQSLRHRSPRLASHIRGKVDFSVNADQNHCFWPKNKPFPWGGGGTRKKLIYKSILFSAQFSGRKSFLHKDLASVLFDLNK